MAKRYIGVKLSNLVSTTIKIGGECGDRLNPVTACRILSPDNRPVQLRQSKRRTNRKQMEGMVY